tara:strand:+ start:885 stop:1097 length:213 start_codon:yes stop_codon:yes gene_type:complete
MASREYVRKYDDSRAGRSVLTNRSIQDARFKGEEEVIGDAPAPTTTPRRKRPAKAAPVVKDTETPTEEEG